MVNKVRAAGTEMGDGGAQGGETLSCNGEGGRSADSSRDGSVSGDSMGDHVGESCIRRMGDLPTAKACSS